MCEYGTQWCEYGIKICNYNHSPYSFTTHKQESCLELLDWTEIFRTLYNLLEQFSYTSE
jgi:hypothetical protein